MKAQPAGPFPPLHGTFVRSEEFLLHMNQESEETGIRIGVTKDDERPSRKIGPSGLVVIFQTCHLVLEKKKKRQVHSQ